MQLRKKRKDKGKQSPPLTFQATFFSSFFFFKVGPSDTRVIRLSSVSPIMKTKELQANCWWSWRKTFPGQREFWSTRSSISSSVCTHTSSLTMQSLHPVSLCSQPNAQVSLAQLNPFSWPRRGNETFKTCMQKYYWHQKVNRSCHQLDAITGAKF